MADKNFKIKSGLQVPGVTSASFITTDSSGVITAGTTLPVANGGTGQTTAENAINALLPLQTGNDNKYLQTNGVSTQWTKVFYQSIKDNGTTVTPRGYLNIVGGTFTDSLANDTTTLTIPATWDYTFVTSGGSDTNWKKLIDITTPTGLYTGISYEIDVIDNNDNYGITNNIPSSMKFYVKITRSAGVQDDTVNAVVLGPAINYVRVVKNSSSSWEIQARQYDVYKINIFRINQVVNNNCSATIGGVSWSDLSNGTAPGTSYVPDNSSYAKYHDSKFSRIKSNAAFVEPLGGDNLLLKVKGSSSQTANLQEWQNSSGTVLSSVSAGGLIRVNNTNTDAMITATGNSTYDAFRFRNAGGLFLWGGGANNNIYYANSGTFALTGGNWVSGRLAVDTGSTSSIGVVVRGQASQTANLQEWQNSSGTVLASIASTGQINAGAGFYTDWAGVGTGRIGSAHLSVAAQYLGNIVGIFKGASGQTANLTEWQNSSGTVLASINASGNLMVQDLTVNGTTTTINSTTLTVDDKNIELASVTSPTDTTADGAGITIKGATDKTFNWVQSTTSFTSSEPISAPAFKSAGTAVSSNITLVSGYRYFVDTTSARTLTLPASPSLGDEIQIYDASNNALTNNITIASNSNKIQGSVQDLIIDSNAATVYLTYTGSTYGWAVN